MSGGGRNGSAAVFSVENLCLSWEGGGGGLVLKMRSSAVRHAKKGAVVITIRYQVGRLRRTGDLAGILSRAGRTPTCAAVSYGLKMLPGGSPDRRLSLGSQIRGREAPIQRLLYTSILHRNSRVVSFIHLNMTFILVNLRALRIRSRGVRGERL
jgi:hypothetical protein